MRLFFAVSLSDDVKITLQKLQGQIKSQVNKGSFTRPENFHLTLAFLGETTVSRVAVLQRIIKEIYFLPFEITFNRTGCFTHSQKELWWAGINTNDPTLSQLKLLHEQLIKQLEKEGFPIDKRSFNAHITLGRETRHYKPIALEFQEIKVLVDRISLMKSERIGGVLQYTELFGRNL